ncbi:hypothetical protein L0244_27430 [bacterium]|nr:hypothetical protein [bacterium]
MKLLRKILAILIMLSALYVAGCAAHQQPRSIRTGFLLSGPGTMISRNGNGIGVLFGNAGKTYVMNLEISGDYMRFYDQFSRRGYGEKIRFEFLPGDKVAIGGFVFTVRRLVEHQVTSTASRDL